MESNVMFLDAWDAINHRSPGFEGRRGGLIEVSWSGQPSLFLNLAVTAHTPVSIEEFDAAVHATCRWAEPRSLPWILAVSHKTLGDLLPQVKPVLEARGFQEMMPLTGMVAEELLPPANPLPQCERLTEDEPAIGYKMLRVNDAAYGMQIAPAGSLPLERGGWWLPPARMATLLVSEGKEASCAAMFGIGDTRYVAFVATLPEMRKRGLAEAAMRDVLERAHQAGLTGKTWLHASPAGKPLYEQMGYKAVADYTVYSKIPTV